MPPKKAAKPLYVVPDCCGECKFGRDHTRNRTYDCWEASPIAILDDEGLLQFLRGLSVEKDEPACSKFKPRCH